VLGLALVLGLGVAADLWSTWLACRP
jgi:hypothetical protein